VLQDSLQQHDQRPTREPGFREKPGSLRFNEALDRPLNPAMMRWLEFSRQTRIGFEISGIRGECSSFPEPT
jgi:hypothetical protein